VVKINRSIFDLQSKRIQLHRAEFESISMPLFDTQTNSKDNSQETSKMTGKRRINRYERRGKAII
jgi:hypothetical protein